MVKNKVKEKIIVELRKKQLKHGQTHWKKCCSCNRPIPPSQENGTLDCDWCWQERSK